MQRQFIEFVEESLCAGKSVIVGTVYATEGSTYRKSGARVAIDEQGQLFGLVSGGCLESDVMIWAKKVLFDSKSRIIEYDTRDLDDNRWARALGCRGKIQVHLQHWRSLEDAAWVKVQKWADKNRTPSVLISRLNAGSIGPSMSWRYDLIEKGAEPRITLLEGLTAKESPDSLVPEDLLGTVASVSNNSELSAYMEYENSTYFVERLEPIFKLQIFGAGPDSEAVCSLVRNMDWYSELIDFRTKYLLDAKSYSADVVVNCPIVSVDHSGIAGGCDAAIVMTHNLEADLVYLKWLAETSVKYIGVLGPRRRLEELLDTEQGLAKKLGGRLRSPIGLDLGGEGPIAIALSIVSEIQAFRFQGTGESLTTTPVR